MRSFVVALAFLAPDWAVGAGVQLELRSTKPQQLVLEPINIQLFLVNRGTTTVSVALHSAWVPRLRIRTDDGWFDCRSSLAICPGVNEHPWTRMEPDAEVQLGPLPDICPSRPGETWREEKHWAGIPGKYLFQAETQLAGSSELPDGITAPDDAFTGVLTSNIVSIDVNEPSGIDAQALTWARERNDTPMSWAAVKVFPSSYYAAIALLPYIDVGRSDSSKLRIEIERGRFLAWGSVPDSDTPDGWASLSGAELAGWRIERAERILRDQPKASFTGWLRLAIGVNQIAAGKGSDGRKLLRQLASRPETAEGDWAKRFLGAEGP